MRFHLRAAAAATCCSCCSLLQLLLLAAFEQPLPRAPLLPGSRPTALRVAPCCSPHVALCCSPRVALCCSASRPSAARASRSAALHKTRHAARAAQTEPRSPARVALPNPSHTAARATAAADGGAARSAGVAAAQSHRAALVLVLVLSLGSGSHLWRSTRSSSVLGSSCEAEIYGGAMGAQELCWLTYLLSDFGERPRSPPVLYFDIKAMLALCHEQRLEHRTKHIALHYFLARELQQHRQLRLSYVASRANTADVFTKALGSGDHQSFCTALGLMPTLPHLLVA
ncbi:unnamed protein product [Closterium sp. NIES-53]